MPKVKKDYSDRPYNVGKGKAPADHRFKPGRSGNPKGRPPKAPTADRRTLSELLVEVANERIVVMIQGVAREVSKREAIVLAMINDAMAATPAQRARTFAVLEKAGAFNLLPRERPSDAEARRKFLERLAQEAERNEASGYPYRRGGDAQDKPAPS